MARAANTGWWSRPATGPVTLRSNAPEQRFEEVDQTDPAGRWRWQINGDVLKLQRATSASWAAVEDWLTFDKAAEKITANKTLNITTEFELDDDEFVKFGMSEDVQLGYETADANANALILALPVGDAVNVPVFVIGDAGIINVDLTFFNGVVQPRAAIVDVDRDSWVALGFNADDDARILIGGSAALTLPALTFAGNTTITDDLQSLFGTGGPAAALWETADANANALLLALPVGGAVDVPALVIGDANAINVDLGFFNGITMPTFAVLNIARDAYISIDAGDDNVAAARGIYFKAAADENIEIINLSVTGTPRFYWDEANDRFAFNVGLLVPGTLNMGTAGITSVGAISWGDIGNFDARNTIDGDYVGFRSRDSDTDVLVEVARLAGATDPYWSFGGSQQIKFYNSGYCNFGSGASLLFSGGVDVSSEPDLAKIGDFDLSADNRTFSFATEHAVAASAGQAVTHKVGVRWNGATYYILLSNV